MSRDLRLRHLGWPCEGPMVLPLILSLRFLIKEKEKKWLHKTFKTFFGVIENSPSAGPLSMSKGMPTRVAAATAAASLLSVASPLDGKTFQRQGIP